MKVGDNAPLADIRSNRSSSSSRIGDSQAAWRRHRIHEDVAVLDIAGYFASALIAIARSVFVMAIAPSCDLTKRRPISGYLRCRRESSRFKSRSGCFMIGTSFIELSFRLEGNDRNARF